MTQRWSISNAAVRIAALRIDDPLLAPFRLDLDAVVVERNDLQAEPLMERAAQDQLLDLLNGQFVAHGVTTTLPMTLRS